MARHHAQDVLDELDIDPATVGERALFLIEQACYELDRIDKEIMRTSEKISDRMLKVRAGVADGDPLNSLGEIQGMGLDLDRSIALRAQQGEHVRQLARIARDST